MSAASLNEIELTEGWGAGDPTMRARFNFPLYAAHGTTSTTVVYFEVDPGYHLGRHTDSAEEIVLVLAGTGEAVVGDERAPLSPGVLALIPELVPHDVYATGDEPLRVVGFFSTAVLESIFDEPMEPMGVRVLGTPPIEARV